MEANKRKKVLEMRNLSISFSTNAGLVNAIRGVNLDVFQGETLAIVGESGSGKSVTAKAIMGILDKNSIVNSGAIVFTFFGGAPSAIRASNHSSTTANERGFFVLRLFL